MRSIDHLYCKVGRALHKAQLIEYNIVSAYLLLAQTDPTSDRKMQEEHWSRKTLGTLLKSTIDSEALPEVGKLLIKTVVAARNHLAHSFFVFSPEVQTQDGIDKLLREVDAMSNVFDQSEVLFEKVLNGLAISAGIDLDSIKEEARATVLRLSSNIECEG